MVFMAQIEKVLSDLEASLSSADDKIFEVSYYLSESESESKNALCNDRMNAFVDVNDLFVFDDLSIRKSHISKMPFRKKRSASLNVPSRSKLIKSLPRIVRKWLPKLQPLTEPIAKWIPRVTRQIDKIAKTPNSSGPIFKWHMTGNRALLTNFMEKFLRTVRFGNNDFVVIVGYGYVVIVSMTIKKVYYVEGLGHNLFSVGQFCDKGLKVAFRKSTCFVQNEDGVDLLTSDRSSNLYTIALNKVASNSSAPSKGFFFAILVVASTSFTYEASEVIISFIKKTQVNLQLQVQRVRTDNGTEFKNKTFTKFFDEVGITQQFSAARTPQQNDVVERRNRTLVEAARIMLTFANLPLFLWAEAIIIDCFTQNRSIIHKCFNKNPYELMNKRKPNIKFFHVFRCRCYLLNDYDDIRKIKAKGDIGVFVGYSKEFGAFRIYNKQTRKIHESINVNFDEILEMASKQFSLEPGLSNLNETKKSSNPSVSQVSETSKKDLEDLFQKIYEEYFDSSKLKKSLPTNVETSNIEEEVFYEISKLFQGESSISSLNDDVQQCPEEDAYFDASTSFHDPSNVHTFYQPYPYEKKWTKDHPLHKIIGDPKSSVRIRGQLANSCFSCLLSFIEPANVAEALRDVDWVSAMQEELDQFARLKVWRLVPRPEGKTIIKTK
nr:hypothetical protein [Tanacetum cinerariifolium]